MHLFIHKNTKLSCISKGLTNLDIFKESGFKITSEAVDHRTSFDVKVQRHVTRIVEFFCQTIKILVSISGQNNKVMMIRMNVVMIDDDNDEGDDDVDGDDDYRLY